MWLPFMLKAGSGSPSLAKNTQGGKGGSWQERDPGAVGYGAHLIHSILREVELGQAGGVDVGYVCPPAEEDKGTGTLGQWAQEHLDEGLLLRVGMSG